MKLLLTTNARLYKGPDNRYYTPIVYDYNFFKRYLDVFDEVRLVAHTETALDSVVKDMLLVSGDGLEIYELPFPHGKWGYIKDFLKIQKKVNDAVVGCDAALFRVPDILAFQIFPVVRSCKIPIALEVTSDPLELYSSKGGRYPLRMLIKWSHYWALRYCCKKANCVSYVTSSYLQSVYPSGIKKEDCKRFESNYTDAGIYQHNVVRDFGNKKLSMLHVSGSISGKVKGHKELIESFITLRKQGFNLTLNLVGSGNLDNDIVEKLFDSGFSQDVFFTGRLNSEQLQELYATSDIFVFPSYREGLPRVVVEAMSWGLPCVCTDLPGCRELLPSRVLVPVKDSISLTNIIRNLLVNPEYLHKESLNNLMESRKYLWGNITSTRKAFYDFLKKLVNKQR